MYLICVCFHRGLLKEESTINYRFSVRSPLVQIYKADLRKVRLLRLPFNSKKCIQDWLLRAIFGNSTPIFSKTDNLALSYVMHLSPINYSEGAKISLFFCHLVNLKITLQEPFCRYLKIESLEFIKFNLIWCLAKDSMHFINIIHESNLTIRTSVSSSIIKTTDCFFLFC